MSADSKNSKSGEKDLKNSDDSVGYKKPPKATRFTKGTSGNPRGRPRKHKGKPIGFSDTAYDSFLIEETFRKLKLLENGKEVELLVPRAIMRARIMSALKGNRFAQKAILEELEKKQQKYDQFKLERYVNLARIKREGEEKLAEAKRTNTAPPKLLPHPHDIILDPSTCDAYVYGPETEEEEKVYEYDTRFRDFLLLKAVHEGELESAKPKGNAKPQPSYLLSASLINRVLPARYRWQNKEAENSPHTNTHLHRRNLADHPPEMDLVLDFMNLSRKERAQRIAEEFSELRANRPPVTPSHNSKETKKVERILEGILIKMNKAA